MTVWRKPKNVKNKKSLKNLKQFRKFKTRAKFQFYVVFRPKAQKWFFVPALVYIVFLGVNDWYDKKWDGWNFINETNAGSLEILTNDSSTTSPVVDTKSPSDIEDSVQVETKTKGGAAPVAPQVEVIKKVAEKEGISWKILYAICKKESGCNPNPDCSSAKGKCDGGKSLGAFQMHQGYQPNTKDCALNLECAAEWTAKRLKKHAHLGLWDMIRSHNGLVGDRDGDGEVDNAYYPNDVLKIIETL